VSDKNIHELYNQRVLSEHDRSIHRKLDAILEKQGEQGNAIRELNRVVFGDPVTKEWGLYDRQKADEEFQHMKIEEMSSLRQSVDKLEKTVEKFIPAFEKSTEKLAELSLWKDGIQSSPKRAAKWLLWLSGFVAAVATIKDFVVDWFSQLLNR